jgi:hypothetical protein
MKLLSRCAGNTREDAAGRANLAARTAANMVRSFAGEHAIDVGQNAVTP